MSIPITDLVALAAAPATGDLLVLVDVSDSTQSPEGSTKSMTVGNLFTAPTFTNASVTGTLAVSGNFSVGSNTFTVAASSGNTVVEGTLSVTGQILPADTIASSKAGAVLVRTGATTTGIYAQLVNTGGNTMFGTESSTGATLINAAAAYATVLGSVTSTSLQFATNNTIAVTIDTSQNVRCVAGITSTAPTGAGIGYATGAGGTVTQATNRVTGVTIDKLSGAITTSTAALNAEAAATFTVTNSTVAIGDTVVPSQRSGSNGGNTDVYVSGVAAGSFNITVANNNPSGGTAETGAIIINFAVIKAVSA